MSKADGGKEGKGREAKKEGELEMERREREERCIKGKCRERYG